MPSEFNSIPSDEELHKQLSDLYEQSHFKVSEELRGIDWFSFFDEEIKNEEEVNAK